MEVEVSSSNWIYGYGAQERGLEPTISIWKASVMMVALGILLQIMFSPPHLWFGNPDFCSSVCLKQERKLCPAGPRAQWLLVF